MESLVIKQLEKKFIGAVYMIMTILILGTLSACGSGENNVNETGENNGELSGDLEVWGSSVAASAMEIAAEQFEEEHPEVNISVQSMGQDDVYDRLTVGMASGGAGLPDVVQIESHMIENYLNEFPEGFLNLSEYGFDEHADNFSEYKIEATTNEDGDFVAMPWDIGPAGLFYRTDIFEEAGVDPNSIETWEDYKEAGIQIREAADVGLFPIGADNDDVVYRLLMNQQGTFYYDDEGRVNLNSEESVRAMNVLNDMWQEDILVNTNGWDDLVGAVVNGQVASIPIGVWFSGTLMDQAPELEGSWEVMELPAFSEGDNRAANSGGSDIAIPSGTDNPDLAYAFAEFYTTDDDMQVQSLEQYGLFPSLETTYDDPVFEEESDYFNGQPIFSLFTDIVPEVEPSNYTNHFNRGQDVMHDVQASIFLNNASVEEALQTGSDRLGSETGREQN